MASKVQIAKLALQHSIWDSSGELDVYVHLPHRLY